VYSNLPIKVLPVISDEHITRKNKLRVLFCSIEGRLDLTSEYRYRTSDRKFRKNGCALAHF
jgi:hypothetical protein